MIDDANAPPPFSLKRWSQRKLAAARAAPTELLPATNPAPEAASSAAIPEVAPAKAAEAAALPPIESLTFESDFSAFMQPKVDAATRRAALRKLFSDPSFNVMDGLDIYVGDYTQPDPMPPGMLEKLAAAYAAIDPAEPPREQATANAETAAEPRTAPVPEPATSADAAAEASVAPESPAEDIRPPAETDSMAKPA
jgi:hypothetical protein